MIDISTTMDNLSEEQKQLIEQIAKNSAYRFFFCNVDDDDFPKDPIEFIYDKCEKDNSCFAFEFEDGDERLEIWEPFENYMLGDIVGWLEDLIEDNKIMLLKAISIIKG